MSISGWMSLVGSRDGIADNNDFFVLLGGDLTRKFLGLVAWSSG